MSPGEVRDGMRVVDSNGQWLGRVARRFQVTFLVREQRRLGRKRYVARYDRIGEIEGDTIRLTETGAQLEAEAYATPPLEEEARIEDRGAS